MSNHIDTVRQHLLDQMAALRGATSPETVKLELEKAKGISELAQVAVNTAKVEVDYLVATDQTTLPFLASTKAGPSGQDALPNGITSITQHRLQG